jgi:hypothetical protein
MGKRRREPAVRAAFPPPVLLLAGAAAAAVGTVLPAVGHAQHGPADAPAAGEPPSVELTPPPSREPAFWAGYLHLDFAIPVARGAVCPSGAACILEGGGGIDLGVERRLPSGLSIGLAYGAIFLDGGGVFEIGVLQFLGPRFRYGFLPDRRAHPFLAAGPMLVLFGETFELQTAGGGFELEAGVDVELDPSLRLRVSLPLRAFVLSEFTTRNDGVRRADGFGVDAVLFIRVGLVVLDVP